MRNGGRSIFQLSGTDDILSGVGGPLPCAGDVRHTPGIHQDVINVH